MSLLLMVLAALLLVVGLFMLWQGDAKRSYAKEFGGGTALLGLGLLFFAFGGFLWVLLGLASIIGSVMVFVTITKRRSSKAIGR